jgi:hypothetical protein
LDTNSEPPWAGAMRKALMAAVKMVREGGPSEVMPHILDAMTAGWKAPDDAYADFWRTARAINELEGSIKQFPIKQFFDREVERNATSSV